MTKPWIVLVMLASAARAAAAQPAPGQPPAASAAPAVSGQVSPAQAAPEQVEMDPLQCWWRTSAAAVRIGEPFTVVLTCGVIETDAVKVVPDQSTLEPTAIQMPPFEVMDGDHPADLRSDDHRFFQYSYRLRVISEDVFGKDVKLPDLKITYRVQSRVNGSTLEGIEKTYLLPSQSVRVLSIVTPDATDIRDATTGTFGDVGSRSLRASLFTTVGSVLFGLAGLMVVLALVNAVRRWRRPHAAATGLITDSAILRGVASQLSAIGRDKRASGWTPELSSRLLTSLRVLAAYALSRPAGQRPAPAGYAPRDGELVIRGGWTRGTRVVVSGSSTAQGVTAELARHAGTRVSSEAHRALLADLEPALTHLTALRYGRDTTGDAGPDDALETGVRVARRLRLEHTWPARLTRAIRRTGVELGQRVWSH